MPIEIKELHIHVSVNATPGLAAGKANAVNSAEAGQDDDGKEAIIAECIEQVMQILQNKKER